VLGPICSKQKLPAGIVQRSPSQQMGWPSACICLFYANSQSPKVCAAALIHFAAGCAMFVSYLAGTDTAFF